MTKTRWEVISKIKSKLFHDFYYLVMLAICVAYMAGRMSYVISGVESGELSPVTGYMLIALGASIFLIYVYCKEGGVFFDLLFWDVQHTDWICCRDFYVSSHISLVFNSIVGKVIRINGVEGCPKELNFYKKLVTVPGKGNVKFFYLKRSKIVIELLNDGDEKSVDDEWCEDMKEPVIPQLCRQQIWHMFRKHHRRPFCMTGIILVGLAGILGFIIYARTEYIYWFVLEPARFWGTIAFFSVVICILWCIYRKEYKGYWTDMFGGKVLVTEVIPYNKAVCAKYVNVSQGKVCAVGIRVDMDKYQKDLFIIYNNVSKYWNCFSMDLEHFYKGVKYQSGDDDFQAVRFYYLKYSKLVIGVEAIENGRKRR